MVRLARGGRTLPLEKEEEFIVPPHVFIRGDFSRRSEDLLLARNFGVGG